MIHNKIEVHFVYITKENNNGYVDDVETIIIDQGLEQNITSNRYYQAQNLNMQLSRVIRVRTHLISKDLEKVRIDNKEYKINRTQHVNTNYSIIELSDYN